MQCLSHLQGMQFFNNFAAKQKVMTIEEYFYLEHYLEHYSIIFHNHNMKTLVEEVVDYLSYLFKNTDNVSFDVGRAKVEHFYNKAHEFDYWSKPTFRIDEPKPFA